MRFKLKILFLWSGCLWLCILLSGCSDFLSLCSSGLFPSENLTIYKINIDGTNKIQLTNKSKTSSNPIFSSNGNKIAFDNRYKLLADKDFDSDINIIDANGSNFQIIVSSSYKEYSPQFSPDNSKIAYIKDMTSLAIINLNTNATTNIVNSLGYIKIFQWSPDGTKIIFDADIAIENVYHENYSIYSVNSDGLNLVKLTDGCYPKWSPDGSKIAFQAVSGGIFTMGSTGENIVQLSTTGKHPEWSADNSKILYDNETTTCNYIEYINISNSSKTMLAEGTSKEYSLSGDGFPKWSPDNSKILFTKDTIKIMVMDVNSRSVVELIKGRSPQWAPDGTQIVFYSEE